MILSHKIFDQYLFLNFFLIFKTNSRIVPFTDGVVVTDFAIVKIANIFAKKQNNLQNYYYLFVAVVGWKAVRVLYTARCVRLLFKATASEQLAPYLYSTL